MANYTDLSPEQIVALVSQFDLGQVNSCRLMDGGLANSSFHLVAESGEYVATITSSGIKSDQETKNLIELLKYLRNAGFRTTEVVPTPGGAYAIAVDGGALFLKKYIKGKVIRDLEPNHLQQIGEQLAQLHNIDPPEFLPDVFSYGI